MKTKNTRLPIENVKSYKGFDQALKVWHETVADLRHDLLIKAYQETWDNASNVYISITDPDSPLNSTFKPVLQTVIVPPHDKGEQLALYPDRQYTEDVLIPNYLAVHRENTPIFRRIMTTMQGRFAIYESIVLPYFTKSQRLSIGISRPILQIENVNPAPQNELSERERECLDLLSQGMVAKQIAVAMGLSERTVEHKVENIKKKLGARSIPQAIAKDFLMAMADGSLPSATQSRVAGVRLSTRESQCLGLVASGHSNIEIAGVLGISHKSVEKHIVSVREKLGAKNAAELTALGLLVTTEDV